MTDPIVHAYPALREHLLSVVIVPLAAVMLTAFCVVGADALLWPGLLSDTDHARNRLVIGLPFVVSVLLISGYIVRSNRVWRHFRVYPDRITFGASEWQSIAFADIQRIRVGAPMPAGVAAVGKVNEALGVVSSKNRNAAAALSNAYAATVVIDTLTYGRVFQIGTVKNGVALLQALVEHNADRVHEPLYTDAERKRYGRFTPGTYSLSAADRAGVAR